MVEAKNMCCYFTEYILYYKFQTPQVSPES